jgi:hypothetical protein
MCNPKEAQNCSAKPKARAPFYSFSGFSRLRLFARQKLVGSLSRLGPPLWKLFRIGKCFGKEPIGTPIRKQPREPLQGRAGVGRETLHPSSVQNAEGQSLSIGRAYALVLEPIHNITSRNCSDLHTFIEGNRPGFCRAHVLPPIGFGAQLSQGPSEFVLISSRGLDKEPNLERIDQVDTESITIWVDVWEGLVYLEIIDPIDIIPLVKGSNYWAPEDKVVCKNVVSRVVVLEVVEIPILIVLILKIIIPIEIVVIVPVAIVPVAIVLVIAVTIEVVVVVLVIGIAVEVVVVVLVISITVVVVVVVLVIIWSVLVVIVAVVSTTVCDTTTVGVVIVVVVAVHVVCIVPHTVHVPIVVDQILVRGHGAEVPTLVSHELFSSGLEVPIDGVLGDGGRIGRCCAIPLHVPVDQISQLGVRFRCRRPSTGQATVRRRP